MGLKTFPSVFMLVLAAAPLLLTGCVPEDGVTKGPAKSPQATAPALQPSDTTASPVQSTCNPRRQPPGAVPDRLSRGGLSEWRG